MPKARVARDLGVGRSTLYRALERSQASHESDAFVSRNATAKEVRE
ncbi:helix-turn-helix domain-containing protein [Tessaracoccus flavescens]